MESEIKITQRNVTGMHYQPPKSIWFIESAKLIMVVAVVAVVALLAIAGGV